MANIPGKPFTDILGEIENGQLLNELTEAVYNIVAAVQDTHKAGALTLSLSFAPTGKNTVSIDATYKVKEPEHDRPTTTFFVGKGFELLRSDPNQPRLPLHEVKREDSEPVRVKN